MAQPETPRRRYAIAGTGHRASLYVRGILGPHADRAELVGWCDPNPTRIDVHDEQVRTATGRSLDRADPEGLEDLLARQRVQTLIVTSPDHAHADLLTRAVRAGADVVVEKPLTIDAAGCRAISEAVQQTGRHVTMTFNYRYAPRNGALREVIASGQIGEVTSVHFEWVLDTRHGADYFRRWHREQDKSGGLLVHKSSHHVDLVNWWLGDVPQRVYARGGLRFYGDRGAGIGQAPTPRPARGTGADAADPWVLDLRSDERLRRLYLEAEHHDGYRRDRDVFDAGITIQDNYAVLVDYSRGALLTYSLNAHGPWEGYRVSVNGTQGRAELEVVERGAVPPPGAASAAVDPSVAEDQNADPARPAGQRLVVQRHWEVAREVPIPVGSGGHGGADEPLLADIFGAPRPDPLGRKAGYHDGIAAVGVGIAAAESMRTGAAVSIEELQLHGTPA